MKAEAVNCREIANFRSQSSKGDDAFQAIQMNARQFIFLGSVANLYNTFLFTTSTSADCNALIAFEKFAPVYPSFTKYFSTEYRFSRLNEIILIAPSRSVIRSELFGLFNAFTPIKQNETDEICKWILKDIMPAILEKNFESFCYSIEQIMKIGFRAKEIHYYGDFFSDRISALKQVGLNGVGMTSFGPTLFGFFDDYSTQTFIINYLNTLFPTDTVIFTTTRNVCANINAY